MTVVDAPTAEPGDGDGKPVQPGSPKLADGVELIGEYEGSGYRDAPSLARRSDGTVIQLSQLLFAVAEASDGHAAAADIAKVVSSEINRTVSASNVEVLVGKLRDIGVLAAADGTSPAVEKGNPFLALSMRASVVSEGATRALATAFKPLFFPLIVLAVIGGVIAFDVWLFGTHGVAQATRTAIDAPLSFLLVLGITVIAAAFHEVGHAAGCRYGGAEPGRMGCGLYLVWPAFYTDVTDAYRLGRAGRLRTDLGGVYFNMIAILAVGGAYALTGYEPLLLAVVVQHIEIVHQLIPVVRLDGYYIVADLTGVPDLFARIGPILRSVLPWNRPDDKVKALKPWVRWVVTAWVVVVIPLLLLQLIMVFVQLPRILATAWASAGKQLDVLQAGLDSGDWLGVVAAGLQLVVLSIPIVGILAIVWKTASTVTKITWQRTAGRPALRTISMAGLTGLALLVVSTWIPGERRYRPITPKDRGTVVQGVRVVASRPAGSFVESKPTDSSEPRSDRDAEPGDDPNSSTTTSTPRSTTSTTDNEVVTDPDRTTATTARRSTATTSRPATTTTQPAGSTTTSAPTTATTSSSSAETTPETTP